ncbi:MAG: glycoside hydrolase [Actinomycetota bacterium]|nr:glycoside hydrolase [Actinomycetota bacterium]
MRRSRPTVLLAGLAAAATITGLATPGDAAGRPGPRWDKPVLVSSTQAARETSFAMDPQNTRRQFICDPSGVPNTDHGQSYFHRSRDGGRNWQGVNVETAATDTRKATFEGGDCDVAYDAGGTMYSADTWLGNLSVGHSTDHGETWGGTSIAVSSPIVDRPWLVGGPKGTVYLSYQDLQCCVPSALWFAVSHDYGQTFSRSVLVTKGQADGLYTWEGNFVVGRGGTDIWLVYSRRSSGVVATGASAPETIWVTQSHDGGATWQPHLVATIPQETTSIYPSIGLDAGGDLHVVWCAPATRGKGTPVSYAASTDHGLSWSSPVSLNPGKVGWAPWVVGGAAGQAAVAWLGSNEAAATASTNSDWYFSWAKVSLHPHGRPTVRTGNTTSDPVWSGKQTVPEFEMLRLDAKGKMHLGMSVFRRDKGVTSWAVYSQNER